MAIYRNNVLALLRQLADERRHVVSDWRAMVLLQRIARAAGESSATANKIKLADARRLLERSIRDEVVRPVAGVLGVYEVTVPYANVGAAGELEVLMETQPCVAASHHTAMVLHDLTDDQPKVLHATVPTGRGEFGPPAGTTVEDWTDLPRAPARFPDAILGTPVRWHRVQPQRYGGVGEYKPDGWVVRVTTPERTLIDGLLDPESCGGIVSVLRGWARARDLLDVRQVVALTEQLDVNVLRQRVGYVLESIGCSHDALDAWSAKSSRGGSSKLDASTAYATQFSERWNISLNAPVELLLAGDE